MRNPEDRFSHNEAQLSFRSLVSNLMNNFLLLKEVQRELPFPKVSIHINQYEQL